MENNFRRGAGSRPGGGKAALLGTLLCVCTDCREMVLQVRAARSIELPTGTSQDFTIL